MVICQPPHILQKLKAESPETLETWAGKRHLIKKESLEDRGKQKITAGELSGLKKYGLHSRQIAEITGLPLKTVQRWLSPDRLPGATIPMSLGDYAKLFNVAIKHKDFNVNDFQGETMSSYFVFVMSSDLG
jgi:hypothetical protein